MLKQCWLVGVGLLVTCFGPPGEIRYVPSSLPQAVAGETQLKFEIYEDRAKEHRWRLKAANGKILATAGQGYTAKSTAKTAVDHLVKDIGKYTFEVYEDRGGEFRWRLKASNGQIVAAASEGYTARAGCEHAIDLIKKNVAKAQVD
jgi:uncharacterized protein YegP (UPF0339 family)